MIYLSCLYYIRVGILLPHATAMYKVQFNKYWNISWLNESWLVGTSLIN